MVPSPCWTSCGRQLAQADVEHRLEEQPNRVTPIIPANTVCRLPSAPRRLRHARAPAETCPGLKATEALRSGEGAGGRLRAGLRRPPLPWNSSSPRELYDQDRVLARQAHQYTRPTCTKRVVVAPNSLTPASAESMHIGTIKITASGSSKLCTAQRARGRPAGSRPGTQATRPCPGSLH